VTFAGPRASPSTIAVLDWGIGGIATLIQLRAALPDAALVYRSDAGFTPYGKVPADALAARITSVALDLDRRFGLAALVLACNAASTISKDLVLPFPVFDTIAPGIALALEAQTRGALHIGIIGGQRTIAAAIHARALQRAGLNVTAVSAQPLSAHVEAGRLDGPELLADLTPVLTALGDIDALLLACTHYPALTPVITRLRPRLPLLDPAAALVARVHAHLTASAPTHLTVSASANPPGPTLWVETSGDPIATASNARAAFGVELAQVHSAASLA